MPIHVTSCAMAIGTACQYAFGPHWPSLPLAMKNRVIAAASACFDLGTRTGVISTLQNRAESIEALKRWYNEGLVFPEELEELLGLPVPPADPKQKGG